MTVKTGPVHPPQLGLHGSSISFGSNPDKSHGTARGHCGLWAKDTPLSHVISSLIDLFITSHLQLYVINIMGGGGVGGWEGCAAFQVSRYESKRFRMLKEDKSHIKSVGNALGLRKTVQGNANTS